LWSTDSIGTPRDEWTYHACNPKRLPSPELQ